MDVEPLTRFSTKIFFTNCDSISKMMYFCIKMEIK